MLSRLNAAWRLPVTKQVVAQEHEWIIYLHYYTHTYVYFIYIYIYIYIFELYGVGGLLLEGAALRQVLPDLNEQFPDHPVTPKPNKFYNHQSVTRRPYTYDWMCSSDAFMFRCRWFGDCSLKASRRGQDKRGRHRIYTYIYIYIYTYMYITHYW